METGVHSDWLEANDTSHAIINQSGAAYSRQDFEERQAFLRAPQLEEGSLEYMQKNLLGAIAELCDLFKGAHRANRFGLLMYKLQRALFELRSEFATDFNFTFETRAEDLKKLKEFNEPVIKVIAEWLDKLTLTFVFEAALKQPGKVQMKGLGNRTFRLVLDLDGLDTGKAEGKKPIRPSAQKRKSRSPASSV